MYKNYDLILHKTDGSRTYLLHAIAQCFHAGGVWRRGARRCIASLYTFTSLLAVMLSTANSPPRQLQAALILCKVITPYSSTIHAIYNRHQSYRRLRGLLPELSMVLQSSSLSGPAFGPRVAAMEPPSVLLPLLPLPALKLSPPLSTNCKDS